MTPRKRAKVVSMYRRGWGRRDIAKVLNESYASVSRVFRQEGIGLRQKGPKSPTGKTYKQDIADMMRKPERCKTCGALTQLPCLECEILKKKNARRL